MNHFFFHSLILKGANNIGAECTAVQQNQNLGNNPSLMFLVKL